MACLVDQMLWLEDNMMWVPIVGRMANFLVMMKMVIDFQDVWCGGRFDFGCVFQVQFFQAMGSFNWLQSFSIRPRMKIELGKFGSSKITFDFIFKEPEGAMFTP